MQFPAQNSHCTEIAAEVNEFIEKHQNIKGMAMSLSNTQHWYFAYGSNMSTQQMLKRTGSIPESHIAQLNGYRLAFRKFCQTDEVYADVLPDASKTVLGVAYKSSQHLLERLDIFEGVAEGCYRRESVQVQVEETNECIEAVVYLGSIAFCEIESQPSQEYLDRILAGLRDHQIDSMYVQSVLALARRKHQQPE